MIDKAWETFLDRTKEISRYYVGIVAETGETLYKHRDRLLAIAWKDASEHFVYRGWSTDNPETAIAGEDDRVSWIKSWIEERDRHDQAEINAWRASIWLRALHTAIADGYVPPDPPEIYFWEHRLALGEIERGFRLAAR